MPFWEQSAPSASIWDPQLSCHSLPWTAIALRMTSHQHVLHLLAPAHSHNTLRRQWTVTTNIESHESCHTSNALFKLQLERSALGWLTTHGGAVKASLPESGHGIRSLLYQMQPSLCSFAGKALQSSCPPALQRSTQTPQIVKA